MKKLLFIGLCCLCLCGCDNFNNKNKEYLECILTSGDENERTIKIDNIYFGDDNLVNKICTKETIVYNTVDDAIEGFKIYGSVYENAKLEGTIIKMSFCNEKINSNAKRTITDEKNFYEHDFYNEYNEVHGTDLKFNCEIKDTNE